MTDDKDYVLKRGFLGWALGMSISTINVYFQANGIHQSNNTIRSKIHRLKDRLSYEEMNDIIVSLDLPREVLNPERVLAKKGIFPPEARDNG